MELCTAHVNCRDEDEARSIGRVLVEERLAACVNIVGGVHSIYRWQGKQEEGKEALLLVKTRASLATELIERVKELHSYECPSIIVLPVMGANQECIEWVKQDTMGES